MTNKMLGIMIMSVSIILMIFSFFELRETKFGYTSISLDHSVIMLCIGYLIYQSKDTIHSSKREKNND